MSQQDCLDFLNAQREKDPERWFKVKEIQDGLRDMGRGNGTIKNAWSHLMKLSACGDISWKGVGAWNHYKLFRAK